MADRTVLEATTRTLTGKKVKQMRRGGRIPATVYGNKIESVSIDVDARAFRHVHHVAGDTQLIDLVLDGAKARPVLIHSTQVDPRRNTAMHVEFFQANLLQKLTAHIPIRLFGDAPATKHGFMVMHSFDTVEVECLPNDLPQDLQVDISGLTEVGDAIHIRDLDIDRAKVAIALGEDEVVVHVVAPQVVRGEDEEGEVAAAEPAEAGGEASAAETDASAEGE
jgi:large subunit ribosomal protein L25